MVTQAVQHRHIYLKHPKILALMIAVLKTPSALLPLAMSLTVMLVHGAITGFVREEDERAAAHILQILIPAQIPIIAFFATKWLPQNSKQALIVLALQIGAALTVLAPVFFLNV
jgi:hypothetical protein